MSMEDVINWTAAVDRLSVKSYLQNVLDNKHFLKLSIKF